MSVIVAFAAIYLIWGTTYLGIALAIETLPPFTSGAIRFLSASLLMYVWLRSRQIRPFAKIDWRMAIICGGLLTGAGNGLVVWAQQGVPSGIAALVVASIPVFVLIINWLFFAKKAPSIPAALGIALAVVGVVLIVAQTQTISGQAQPLHMAAILLAVLSWSIGTLLQQRHVRSEQVIAFTCAQIFFGGLWQLLFASLNNEWKVFDASQISTRSLMAVAYLSVFGSIVAFNCYAWLLTRVSAQKVATYALVNPAVALLLGAWILEERITTAIVGAVSLVLLGVALVLFQVNVANLWRRLFGVRKLVRAAEQ